MQPSIDRETLQEVQTNIDHAKLKLMMRKATVFFSALLANLKLQITDRVPTAATNGVELLMNPQFVLDLERDQLIGLMLHEVMHVVFDDMSRLTELDLDKTLWNMACDHRINLELLRQGYKLPEDGLHDPRFRGMSARQIYDILEQEQQPKGGFQMDIFESLDGEELSDQERSELYDQIITNVVKAVQQAEMAGEPGSVPDELRRNLEEILNPRLPWQTILQEFVEPYARTDYSWTRPNKRYLPDFYLPSMQGDQIKKMAVGQDVSASMSEHDVSECIAEVRYIFDVLRPKGLRLMSFDVVLHDDLEYNEGDYLDDVELHGGGGTDVTPFIEMLREEQPELALIFTDGEFHMPDMSGLSTDLIWVIKNNWKFNPPYGRVIYYDA